MGNQRPPNPVPGSPLFDDTEAASAWVKKYRPDLFAAYYRQRGTNTWAVEELAQDHPLRSGAIVFSVNRPRPEKPQPENRGEE